MRPSVEKMQIPEVATRDAIEAFKDTLILRLSEDILKIIFFGSRRRGIFRPDSDIDLLLIVREKRKELIDAVFDVSDMVEQRILHYDIPFTVHILSEKEYNEFKYRKSPFIERIEREGLIVYERVPGS